MKRKTIYVLVACLTFGLGIAVASMWLLHTRTFRVVSQDGVGGPGLGVSGRGIGCSMKTWSSSDGIRIEEYIVAYASVEEAREDFETELKSVETIVEGNKSPDYSSGVEPKLIGTFINPVTKERSIKIIKLQDKEIYYAEARSLEHALAFERSWLKLDW
jgi:hypothetical protein